jgi:hypothetical protein
MRAIQPDRNPEAEKAFISHEFIIYLLKIALKDEDVFCHSGTGC